MKSAIKNATGITLNFSANIVGDSNYENNFPHKLLLTNTQISRLCKALASSAKKNIENSSYIK